MSLKKSLNKIYGGFQTFKRANRGLYGNLMIKSGDQVSEMGNKTKRSFKPNIQYCTMYSELLDKKMKVRLAANIIKQIDDAGGLDNYILNQPVPESWFAEKLKYQMLMAKHEAELHQQDDTSDHERLFNPA